MNPLEVTCPACNAPPSVPCSTPTDTGRRNVQWVHTVREDEAEAREKGWKP